MSTPNYRQPTLSKIYSFEIEDFDDFDMKIANIKDCLQEKIKKYERADGRKWLRDKKIMGEITLDFFDKNYNEWDVRTIYVTVEDGYYSGCMIDADLSEFEGEEIGKTLQKKIDNYCKRIEKILEKLTTPLVRDCLFSNGEANYKLA